ncbi:multidrug resistance-associated protein 1, partial [Biomphalaria pfeifferi]
DFLLLWHNLTLPHRLGFEDELSLEVAPCIGFLILILPYILILWKKAHHSQPLCGKFISKI